METKKSEFDLNFLEYSLISIDINSLGIINCDENFKKITGYDSNDIKKGLNGLDIISSTLEELAGDNIIAKIKKHEYVGRRFVIRKKNGDTAVVNCNFYMEASSPNRVNAIITDVYKNEREVLWSELAKILMSAVNIYDGIEQSLAFLGKHLKLDRTTFVEFDNNFTEITKSLQWVNENVYRTQNKIYDVDLTGVIVSDFFYDYVIYDRTDKNFPPVLAEIFKAFDVTSLLGYVIHDANETYGFIFVESLEKREWSFGQFEILKLLSDVIISGIRKNRTEEMLWLSRENDRKILASIDSVIIVIDADNYEIIYKNNTAKMLFPHMNLGDKCYSWLCSNNAPCSDCPLKGHNKACEINSGSYKVTISEMVWENSKHAAIIQAIPDKRLSDDIIDRKFAFIYQEPCDIYYEINITNNTCKTTILNEKAAFPLDVKKDNYEAELESFLKDYVEKDIAIELREKLLFRVIRQKRTESAEFELKNPYGGKLWFSFRAASFADENNTVCIITGKNITDQKQLKSHEKQHKMITNKSSRKVYPYLVMVNITKSQYFICRSEHRGINLPSFGDYNEYHNYFSSKIHPNEQNLYLHTFSLERLQEHFLNSDSEITFVGEYLEETDNRYHWLSMVVMRLENTNDNNELTVAFTGRYVDYERKKELDIMETLASYEAANRSKTVFLSRMSHDMRTPMNSIINMTKLASQNLSSPAIAEDCLRKVQISSDYLMSLVSNVLDISKLETGKITLNNDVINLEDFIESVKEIIMPEINLKKQNLRIISKNISSTSVYGDETRLKQVILNLLANAIKFTSEHGDILFEIIETACKDDMIFFTFRISDNGIGISKEFQKRLFIPFEQEHAGAKSYDGSGLGLSICRFLIELMGGKIYVKSEVGKGSIFEVKMSFQCCEHIVKEEKNDTMPINLAGKRVLLVEDDKINAEIAEMLLNAENIQSEIAFDGKMAVEKFSFSKEFYYDAILMDIQMPVMDGKEATKIIRAMKRKDAKKIPIISMTANAFQNDIEEVIKIGMNYHISKPVNAQLLYETLQKSCGNK